MEGFVDSIGIGIGSGDTATRQAGQGQECGIANCTAAIASRGCGSGEIDTERIIVWIGVATIRSSQRHRTSSTVSMDAGKTESGKQTVGVNVVD